MEIFATISQELNKYPYYFSIIYSAHNINMCAYAKSLRTIAKYVHKLDLPNIDDRLTGDYVHYFNDTDLIVINKLSHSTTDEIEELLTETYEPNIKVKLCVIRMLDDDILDFPYIVTRSLYYTTDKKIKCHENVLGRELEFANFDNAYTFFKDEMVNLAEINKNTSCIYSCITTFRQNKLPVVEVLANNV
jgi:hypothetical protein